MSETPPKSIGSAAWNGLIFVLLVALLALAGFMLPVVWALSAKVDALEQSAESQERAIGVLRAELLIHIRASEEAKSKMVRPK